MQIVRDHSRAEFTEITLKGEPIIDFFSNLNITTQWQIVTDQSSDEFTEITLKREPVIVLFCFGLVLVLVFGF